MNNKIRILLTSALCIISLVVIVTSCLTQPNSQTVINIANPTPTVIIDPGHGGIDAGASVSNVLEKNINLDISLILKHFLESYGFDVVLTRDTDTQVCTDKNVKSKKRADLQKRVDIFNSSNKNIVISIHQNMFSQEQYNGTQTFYSKNNADSEILANCIQSSVRKLLQPDNQRECKQAGSEIFILDNTHSVCVLVECGFLSNRNDLQNLTDKKYQNEIAYSICLGFLEYYYKNNK